MKQRQAVPRPEPATPERPTELEKLLNYREVMDLLNVSKPTVYRLIEQKGLPVIRLGRAIRVRPSALQKWIAELEETNPPW